MQEQALSLQQQEEELNTYQGQFLHQRERSPTLSPLLQLSPSSSPPERSGPPAISTPTQPQPPPERASSLGAAAPAPFPPPRLSFTGAEVSSQAASQPSRLSFTGEAALARAALAELAPPELASSRAAASQMGFVADPPAPSEKASPAGHVPLVPLTLPPPPARRNRLSPQALHDATPDMHQASALMTAANGPEHEGGARGGGQEDSSQCSSGTDGERECASINSDPGNGTAETDRDRGFMVGFDGRSGNDSTSPSHPSLAAGRTRNTTSEPVSRRISQNVRGVLSSLVGTRKSSAHRRPSGH